MAESAGRNEAGRVIVCDTVGNPFKIITAFLDENEQVKIIEGGLPVGFNVDDFFKNSKINSKFEKISINPNNYETEKVNLYSKAGELLTERINNVEKVNENLRKIGEETKTRNFKFNRKWWLTLITAAAIVGGAHYLKPDSKDNDYNKATPPPTPPSTNQQFEPTYAPQSEGPQLLGPTPLYNTPESSEGPQLLR